MKGYLCENLDEKLASRIFIGKLETVVNLIVLFSMCTLFMLDIKNKQYTSIYGILLIVFLIKSVVDGVTLYNSKKDILCLDDKCENLSGYIVYLKDSVAILQNGEDEPTLFNIPRCVKKKVLLRVGDEIIVTQTKHSHLVREVIKTGNRKKVI